MSVKLRPAERVAYSLAMFIYLIFAIGFVLLLASFVWEHLFLIGIIAIVIGVICMIFDR